MRIRQNEKQLLEYGIKSLKEVGVRGFGCAQCCETVCCYTDLDELAVS